MKSKKPSAKQLALFQEARTLRYTGQLTQAAAKFQKLLKDFPKDPLILGELGAIAVDLGDFDKGAVLLDKSLQSNPNAADVHFNRAIALSRLNRLDAALAGYEQVIKLMPDQAPAYYYRADILRRLRRTDEAIASYGGAIALRPDFTEAFNDLGLLHQELHQYDQALACYRQAIAAQPENAIAVFNYGNALQYLGRFEEALACYDRLIALIPEEAKAHFNRGQVFNQLKRHEEALACFDKALALKPGYPYLFGQRLFCKMQMCDWRNMEHDVAELAAKIQAGEKVTTPFTVLACIGDLALQRQAAALWTADKYPPMEAIPKIPKHEPHEKIRIAYFSADFRNHAVAFLTAELYERHDRNRFEVIAFSLGPDTQDDMRIRLQSAFDRFIDVQNHSDIQIMQIARDLQIDIAIDLGGHTGESRPGIFAMRAAPLQVSYIGYLGTMGAGYMDYLLADAVIIPEEARPHYLEKIIYLPSYQANDSKRQIADAILTRARLGLPETGFVFCCLNHNYKITSETFAGWMRILESVTGSMLLLLADNASAKRNLQNAAAASGVAATRLVFAERLPAPEYLARYRSADLFLDTLPYNAGTTASDALWAGLPVLTRAGEAFAGRVAASLLTAIGLPELIAATQAQYEAMAIELANSPERLAAIRARLAQYRLTKPLFDIERFTVHIETAYTQIYQRQREGRPAEDLYIEDGHRQ